MSDSGDLGDLTGRDTHRHDTGPGHVTYHVEVEHGRRRPDAKIPESDDGPVTPAYLHHPVDRSYVKILVEPHGKTMDEMDQEAHKNAYDMASATSPHDMVTKTRILHVEAKGVTFPGKHDEQLPLHPDLPVGMEENGLYKGSPQLPLYRGLQLHHPEDVRDHLGKSHEGDQAIAHHFVNQVVHGGGRAPRTGHPVTLGIHWSHDKDATQDLANHAHMDRWGGHDHAESHPVILEADHPGHEHVLNFEDKDHADAKTVRNTVGPHELLHHMLPEVPLRPGAPVHLRAIHVQKHDGTYHRIPVGLHTQASKVPDPFEVHPNLTRYRSGGIGHLPGDEERSVVGMVPLHVLEGMREHDGIQNPGNTGHDRGRIEEIKADLRSGHGLENPIQVFHDPDRHWGYVGEGNHRLRALAEEGHTHAPVRVHSRSRLDHKQDKGIGAPLHLATNFGDGDFPYTPPDVHPHHFTEFAPGGKTASTEPGWEDEQGSMEGYRLPSWHHTVNEAYHLTRHIEDLHEDSEEMHDGNGEMQIARENGYQRSKITDFRKQMRQPDQFGHLAVRMAPTLHRFWLPEDPHEAHAHILGLAGLTKQAAFEDDRLADIHSEGGYTTHVHTEHSPKTGFMASYEGSGHVHHISELTSEHIAAHRTEFAHHLSDPHAYQGGWHDTETGHVFLDVSKHHTDEHEARDFAIKHRQKAYFHLDTMDEKFMDPHVDPQKHEDPEGWHKKYASVGTDPHPGYASYRHLYDVTPQPAGGHGVTAAYEGWRPHDRLFGPTKDNVDPRLFDEHRHMLPAVRKTILEMAKTFLDRYDEGWTAWARIYLAGSEASLWWGNNDFDILVGVHYDRFRERTGSTESNQEISDRLNADFRERWNDEDWRPPFRKDEVWHLTGYVNPNSWDIRNIKPYAAYEVVSGTWFVPPVQVPKDWGPDKFPEYTWRIAENYANEIAYISRLEPASVRQHYATKLFNHIHEDRKRAFGPSGTGVFDVGNVAEKYLDQRPDHPLARLVAMKKGKDGTDAPSAEDAEAAKTAKARSGAPARGQGGQGQGQSRRGQDDDARSAQGSAGPVEITHHPKVEKDLKGFAKPQAKKVLDLIDTLATEGRHPSTEPFKAVKGWSKSKPSGESGIIVVHQHRGGVLHIGGVFNQHDYDKAQRRVAKGIGCETCKGSGKESYEERSWPCRTCDGTGTRRVADFEAHPLPAHQQAIREIDSYSKWKDANLSLAKKPTPGTHIFRGEIRHKDDIANIASGGHGDVGMHWSVNPDAVISPNNHGADMGEHHHVIWHAEIHHPESQTYDRGHPMWFGTHRSLDGEAEVRTKPHSQLHVHAAYVWQGEGHPRGHVYPHAPEKTHEGWKKIPVNRTLEVRHKRPKDGMMEYPGVKMGSKQGLPEGYSYRHIVHQPKFGEHRYGDVVPHPSQEQVYNEGPSKAFGGAHIFEHQIVHKGTPVAKLRYSVHPDEPHVLNIEGLAVHNDHQGKGLAIHLGDRMQDHAEKEGCKVDHGTYTDQGHYFATKYMASPNAKPHLHLPYPDKPTGTTGADFMPHMLDPEEMRAGAHGVTASLLHEREETGGVKVGNWVHLAGPLPHGWAEPQTRYAVQRTKVYL